MYCCRYSVPRLTSERGGGDASDGVWCAGLGWFGLGTSGVEWAEVVRWAWWDWVGPIGA